MEDILKEVLENRKESLKKYDNHNVRTRNITFYPINNNTNNDLLENKPINDSNILIESIQKESESKIISNEKVEKEETSNFSDFILNLSKKFDKDKISKKNKENENILRRKNEAERKKVITYVYDYLFDLMYNYSLCFEEFSEIISRFPDFIKSIPEIKSEPSKPNTRDFIYKLRTVSLIQKINIIAYQIGQYNFSLITKKITDKDVFDDYSPIDLASFISKEYQGTDLDYSAILNLYEIAEADKNGSIVFEDLKKENVIKKEEKPIDKKEQRRKTLGFGSFNLKK